VWSCCFPLGGVCGVLMLVLTVEDDYCREKCTISSDLHVTWRCACITFMHSRTLYSIVISAKGHKLRLSQHITTSSSSRYASNTHHYHGAVGWPRRSLCPHAHSSSAACNLSARAERLQAEQKDCKPGRKIASRKKRLNLNNHLGKIDDPQCNRTALMSLTR